MDATELLEGVRLVPVVVVTEEEQAPLLARTLADAGLRAMEITLRTECALPAIARVAAEVPELLVGAGSVREPEQLRRAAEAGARFVVSPGSSARLIDAARERNMPFVPGAVTATEIMGLLELGYRLQKFFPAESSGGIRQLRALAAPLPEVTFFPTGGISLALAREYLAFERVACVGGSWFVPAEKLAVGDYRTIGELAADAVRELREVHPPGSIG